MPKKEKTDRPVVVSVEWGYDLHDCPMSLRTWNRIVAGKAVCRKEPYWYEGKSYTGEWYFNHDSFGSLVVGYDDGGQGYVGDLGDVAISIDGKDVLWDEVVQKARVAPARSARGTPDPTSAEQSSTNSPTNEDLFAKLLRTKWPVSF